MACRLRGRNDEIPDRFRRIATVARSVFEPSYFSRGMINMWEACGKWMMSFGWLGMLLGTVLLLALIGLIVVLITRVSGHEQRR